MFVRVCKARLGPNGALRVSKSQLLAQLPGFLPQELSTDAEFGVLCHGLCCGGSVGKGSLVQGWAEQHRTDPNPATAGQKPHCWLQHPLP